MLGNWEAEEKGYNIQRRRFDIERYNKKFQKHEVVRQDKKKKKKHKSIHGEADVYTSLSNKKKKKAIQGKKEGG